MKRHVILKYGSGNILIADIMKFFHVDGPVMQFDTESQKGRYYFYPNCDISYIQTYDISHSYQLTVSSLS